MIKRFRQWLCKVICPCREEEAALEVFVPPEKDSDYPVYELPWATVLGLLEDMGLTRITNELPDRAFYYTDEDTWNELLPNLVYPPEYYAEQERRDCDDYSKKASADSSFFYGLNCLQVWGDSEAGYHAFNMVMVLRNEWRLFEPNSSFPVAGKLMLPTNEHGWRARKWMP
ncbi:hypothetical protein CMI37_13870 [Candidatus Pacearchaeota archaeon]|nr:hypothetical protein [Candidatus Pacearchaeota archaeon]|tara:strand:- start:817 stop:1329 length:513 start_codon:yes stop_codon:yes gene_type:complete